MTRRHWTAVLVLLIAGCAQGTDTQTSTSETAVGNVAGLSELVSTSNTVRFTIPGMT